jgi:hypothetical protein
LGNAQNSKNDKRTVVVTTYTVCNPDSSGIFQLMYNNVYNVYGFYKTNRTTYYYNSNNKNCFGVLQNSTMNVSDTVWNNQMKWTNIYDSNNLLIDSVNQYWNATLQQWSDTVERTRFIYDLNQNIVSIKYSIKYNGWLDKNRILHSYNSAGLLILSKYQSWDTLNNKWFIHDSLKYLYDSNNRVTNKYYFYNYTNPIYWNFNVKDTIYYNVFNNPVYLLKTRNIGVNSWITAKEISWTYDANGRILSRVCTGSDWGPLAEDGSSYYYSYDSYGWQKIDYANGSLYYSSCNFVGINEKNKGSEFSIFPNPTNSTLSIKSSLEFSTVKIVNSIGQTIANFEDKLTAISVADLSNGIYFIQLLDKKGNVLKTEKFMKE